MTAQSTTRTAKKLEKQGNIAEAIVVCEAFLSSFPNNRRIQQQVAALRARRRQNDDLPASHKQALSQAFGAGAYGDLVQSIDGLVPLYPTSYFLWNLLGNVQLKLDALPQAQAAFEKAQAIDPQLPNAWVGLGDVQKSRHEPQQAMAHYIHALERDPKSLTALNNIGTLLSKSGQHQAAVQTLSKACDLAPRNPVLLFNLGNAYRDLNAMDRAADCLNKALAVAPELTDARYSLGLVQSAQGALPQAVESFGQVLATAPDHDAARVEKLHQMAHMCDWRWMDAFADLPLDVGARGTGGSPWPFLAMEDNPLQQRKRSASYATRFPGPAQQVTFNAPASQGDRIKIGYFSADFHSHATMYLMAGLFKHHDRTAFEVSVYSFGPDNGDAEREQLIAHTDHFHTVGHLSDTEIAELARRHGLDVAIDLKGYTGDSRAGIFAQRAAPLQISWLGYPGTTGCDVFDYVIADEVVLPAAHRDGFSENVIYMPDSYQVNDNARAVSDRVFTRAECGLPEQGFVFCCFNNSYKITSVEFDIWMRLLAAHEGSVLWLLKGNEWAVANLQSAAEKRGIAPSRLVFAERMGVADHLARQHLADLFLDTFHCNAHTTASDALWVGLPVVTCAGQQFAARVAASLLTAVGLPELVTHNAAEYEALAMKLAASPAALMTHRQTLAANKGTCALFDTPSFAAHLEHAFRSAHQRRVEGLSPADLFVGTAEAS